MRNQKECVGNVKIFGTKRIGRLHSNGDVSIKNYIGDFVNIKNPIILEFYPF